MKITKKNYNSINVLFDKKDDEQYRKSIINKILFDDNSTPIIAVNIIGLPMPIKDIYDALLTAKKKIYNLKKGFYLKTLPELVYISQNKSDIDIAINNIANFNEGKIEFFKLTEKIVESDDMFFIDLTTIKSVLCDKCNVKVIIGEDGDALYIESIDLVNLEKIISSL